MKKKGIYSRPHCTPCTCNNGIRNKDSQGPEPSYSLPVEEEEHICSTEVNTYDF